MLMDCNAIAESLEATATARALRVFCAPSDRAYTGRAEKATLDVRRMHTIFGWSARLKRGLIQVRDLDSRAQLPAFRMEIIFKPSYTAYLKINKKYCPS